MENEEYKIGAVEAEATRIMDSIKAEYIGLDPFQLKTVAIIIVQNIQRSHVGNIGQTLFYSKVKNYIASR